MGRLIDADRLKGEIIKFYGPQATADEILLSGVMLALKLLEAAPTVESEPVRHGKWIFGETMGHSWMKCNQCLKSQIGHTACFTYCPNCGAKMDLEESVHE